MRPDPHSMDGVVQFNPLLPKRFPEQVSFTPPTNASVRIVYQDVCDRRSSSKQHRSLSASTRTDPPARALSLSQGHTLGQVERRVACSDWPSFPPVSASTSAKNASRLRSSALSTTLAMHLPGPGTLAQASFSDASDLPVIYLKMGERRERKERRKG